ncbi:CapA family protein [Halalkalibacter hemicellulosilyticus]|uniref:Capsule synthesis protein CapA domain-containing protein n=1 Tax=Halalkalibacter hemicellulosilyticusJCM 9152 TaxID=1236971 RepID=W4QGU5_9BACI|nr:CapA family protein [Halalkalibacter hemicellulosilyticus]GAE31330.1 hypothetical protein JCM9152_2789 [Halalkalibacter hemicellulosilyticusJCM 9152]
MNKIQMIVVLMLLVLVGCQQTTEPPVEEEPVTPPEETEVEREQEEEPPLPVEKETTISIGAVGDVLLHERLYETAEVEDGYDFMPMLEPVKHLMEAPDFMMANQESLPGGEELGLSTYPMFNSPQEIARDLQLAGVDLVSVANNHTLDRGLDLVYNSIDYYDEIGLGYVGAYRDQDDRDTDRIVDVDGISLGILAYTYGTNGIPVPEGHEYVVALIDDEQMEEDVAALRDQVDILIVHMHWGAEYILEPNEDQLHQANLLAEAGVDIIFGHHPHVLQPIDVIEQEDGHETTVFYSLGNFLSGQNFDYTDIGGIATIDVTKVTLDDELVSLKVHSPHIEPTVVMREEGSYRVRELSEVGASPINGSTHDEMSEHVIQYME